MTTPLPLAPAVERMVALIEATPDDALDRPTPNDEFDVAALLVHVDQSALAFRAAAVKTPLPPAPAVDGAALPADWRTSIPADLRALEAAWREPEAWSGTTGAGGVELPGDVAGIVALDELVVHGWDLAKSIGQPAGYDGPGLPEILEQTRAFRALDLPGLFGPEVLIPEDGGLFEQVLGMTGRDPDWAPPG